MNDNTVALAIVALASAVATGFFTLINNQMKAHTKSSDELSKAFNRVAESNLKIAEATETGNREAKERNGHLADITLQARDQTIEAIVKVMQEQTVIHQTVQHETVLSKDDQSGARRQ